MNKYFHAILITVFCLSASIASASASSYLKQIERIQKELTDLDLGSNSERKQLRHVVIYNNVNYLERKVKKKIKHLEKRLTEYQGSFDDSQEFESVKYLQKKVTATQKKIKELNEVVFAIDILKMRLGNIS